MKTVYICAHACFPRGNAAAIYLENFSLALLEKGYQVYIFSRGKNVEEDWDEQKQCYKHKGIYYLNLGFQRDSLMNLAKNYFSQGRFVIEQLLRLKAEKGDHIIFYSINYFYIREIYKYAKENQINASMIITEWFQFYQYKLGIINPIYWLERIGFNFGVPMSGRVIAISRKLEEHYKKRGCKTLCVPALSAEPQALCKTEVRIEHEIKNFIYSGNSLRKDAIDMIVKAFAELLDEELEKVRLHFTGMSTKTVEGLKKNCGSAYYRIERCLVIHNWMDYQELINLYYEIDYLILLRRKTKVTLSNFPSKVPEMMRYGIIPIVSKVGDYTEKYLKDGVDSIMVAQGGVQNATMAIRKALNMSPDKVEEMKKNASETVANVFFYKNWSETISSFLEEQ